MSARTEFFRRVDEDENVQALPEPVRQRWVSFVRSNPSGLHDPLDTSRLYAFLVAAYEHEVDTDHLVRVARLVERWHDGERIIGLARHAHGLLDAYVATR